MPAPAMRLHASIPNRCEIHAPRKTIAASGPKRLRSLNRNAIDTEENYDLDAKIETGKLIDAAGAGQSMFSPAWLTQLGQLWGGKSDVPVADAKPDDIKDLLGGALFKALFKWMTESGPVYLLPTGPISSFLVISDPDAAKHVLRSSDNPARPIYEKGLVAEVSKFLFGKGFAVADGEAWRVRRKAVGPAFHKGYLEAMLKRVFGSSALRLNEKLDAVAGTGEAIDLEACFSQLTLDVIGKAVFNYEFDSLNTNSPVIQAVYTSLKETETRATDLLPYWKIPFLCLIIPRQQKATAAVEIIRKTTEELVAKCKAMVEAEDQAASFDPENYINDADPSILRFLIASRDIVDSEQLRDDLLSMLVAGHETTGSALTWTLSLLAQNPECMATAQAEVDSVLSNDDCPQSLAQYQELKYCMRCINESMRLYPHPPVLLRRALVPDTLPGGYAVPQGQDIMISVYNIHHSPAVWGATADDFNPMRFGPLDGPVPTEQNTNYKYIPFSGGPRKCVGDQFALMEAVTALAVVLKDFNFKMKPGHDPGMTTGATIHTANGLYMTVEKRNRGVEAASAVTAGASSS